MRDIEAILQKEEDLQKAEELANIDTVAAEAAANVEEDACDIRAAPGIDLCSTEEMMHVFDEYFKGDVQDIGRSTMMINNGNIEANVDVKATEFHLDFSGKVDQVEMPDMDFGTSGVGGWSVDDLLK